MIQTIPILGPHLKERSIVVNNQHLFNMYVGNQLPGAKTPISLYSTPGLPYKNMAGNGACRSNYIEFKGKSYGVNGNKFVSVDTSFITSQIGTLNTSIGRCSIVSGRDYIIIVDGTDGWSYDGTTFLQITSGNFPSNCTHVIYLDGYFIANDSKSDEWAISGLENPTAWNSGDTASGEKRPDNITSIGTIQSQVYLVGPLTCEVWSNTGGGDFPFTRYPNGVLDYGIRSPYSLVRSRYGIIYYARTEEGAGQIVLVNGLSSQSISPDSLNWEISELSDDTDAYSFVYQKAGKTFYQITFPSSKRTYLLDLDNPTNWSRLRSLNTERHRAAGYGYLNGVSLCGDFSNNNIYELSFDSFKDNNDLIRRERITQVISSNRRNLLISYLEIEVEAGTSSDPNADPKILMRYSTDGGKTWSHWLDRPIGGQGEYDNLAIYRVGILGRDIQIWTRCSEDLDFTMVNAYMKIEELGS